MFSYRHKILIDRTIGFILSILFAVVARVLGFILRRDHRPAENPESVAVAKFVGVGSIIYVGYFCRLLKIRFPKTKLYFITTKGSEAIASRLPDVDKVLTVNDSGLARMLLTNLLLIGKLWKVRPDLYFDMEVYSSYSAMIANLSLARNRYGFYRKSVAFKKGLFTHLVFFNTRRHISEIYRQMALAAGAKGDAVSLPSPLVYPEDEDCLNVFLEKRNIHKESLIVINPNVSELLLERRWMTERWAAYLEEATQRWPQFVFALTGVSHEQKYVNQIRSSLSESAMKNVINLVGQLDFGMYLALIKACHCVVTVDSGPLHVAASLGKSTISLWGPGDPGHYAPVSGKHKILYNPVYCSPCLYHADVPPCGGDNRCMQNITVDELLQATDDFIKETPL